MTSSMKTIAALLLCVAAAACDKSKAACTTPAAPAPVAVKHTTPRIQLTSIYVADQDKALHFYTEVLGFAKKDDVTNGPYRWLTVTAPDDADGGTLQLAPEDPAGKAYQQALFEQKRPAAMFFTDDVDAQYEKIKSRGATFTMPPTDIGFAKIAMLDDTVGNLIQITQLH